MANDERDTNNLKSIKSNYGNMSSEDDEENDDNKSNTAASSSVHNSLLTTSNSYKILTPFVPYKNPFIHEDDDDIDDEVNQVDIKEDDLFKESDSKRQRSEFNSKSSACKIYRTKNSSVDNNAACSSHLNDSNDESDVDISEVTINPRIIKGSVKKNFFLQINFVHQT